MYKYEILWFFLQKGSDIVFTDWTDLIKVLISGGLGGLIVQLYRVYIKKEEIEFDVLKEYTENLREDLISSKEDEVASDERAQDWRDKYYEAKEDYHELKREHTDLLFEVKRLEKTIDKLKKKLNESKIKDGK